MTLKQGIEATMEVRIKRELALKQRSVGIAKLSALLLMALSFSHTASAFEFTHRGGDFYRHAYVATGLGFSHLNPDTSEVEDDVNDSVNAGGQITIGVDVHRWFSVELHSADLGSAGLFPAGRINYHVHGASALFYMGKNRDAHARNGLSAYGRTGLGYLVNSPVGNVRFQRDNAFHLLFGAGVEYVTSFGLGARAEILSFDNDVFYSQLALTYRFGRNRFQSVVAQKAEAWVEISNSVATVEKPWIEITNTVPIAPPVAAVVVINPDKDGDDVLNEIDECPSTGPGVSVDATGCALFAGVAEGVNFHKNSARLTSQAKAKIDEIIATLGKHRKVSATISAHTDNWGEADYNQALSERRAKSVLSYMNQNGIQRSRLRAEAYGESRPIAKNETAEGRELNRRVEIVAKKSLQ